MNKFELFCMIFFALDADWDETKDSTIGEYLSSANPFLFEDIGSADSSVYSDFCNCISEPISIESSYSEAVKYLKSLGNQKIVDAFMKTAEEFYNETLNGTCARALLSDYGNIHNLVKRHNEKHINNQLERYSEFFDSCLAYPLDAQQRRSIMSDIRPGTAPGKLTARTSITDILCTQER